MAGEMHTMRSVHTRLSRTECILVLKMLHESKQPHKKKEANIDKDYEQEGLDTVHKDSRSELYIRPDITIPLYHKLYIEPITVSYSSQKHSNFLTNSPLIDCTCDLQRGTSTTTM